MRYTALLYNVMLLYVLYALDYMCDRLDGGAAKHIYSIILYTLLYH